ncbi:MAG: tripartite tricarboxylate transporter substrate binding protein [Clostridia bacterium]
MKKISKSAVLILVITLLFTSMFTACSSKTPEPAPAPANGTTKASDVPTDNSKDTSKKIDYPTKPIQVILPSNPGGDTDATARLISQYMEKEMGQSFVIVNQAGGTGTIAMQKVLSSKPDGYTVFWYDVASTFVPTLSGLINYDMSVWKIPGIALAGRDWVIVARADAPYKNLKELEEYAKANPGQISWAMQTGGWPHLTGIALGNELGQEIKLADIGGTAERIVALSGKKVSLIQSAYKDVQSYVDTGEFTILASMSAERHPNFPDIPTATEQGYEMDFNKYYYFAFPKDTPQEVVDKFSKAMDKVIQNEEFIAKAKEMNVLPNYLPEKESLELIKKETSHLSSFKEKFLAGLGK